MLLLHDDRLVTSSDGLSQIRQHLIGINLPLGFDLTQSNRFLASFVIFNIRWCVGFHHTFAAVDFFFCRFGIDSNLVSFPISFLKMRSPSRLARQELLLQELIELTIGAHSLIPLHSLRVFLI